MLVSVCGVASYPVLISILKLKWKYVRAVYKTSVGVCTCDVYLYACTRQMSVLHSSPYGLCRFAHRVASTLPMCSVGQVPLHSQYRRHHLDLNNHRSVCGLLGVDVWMCNTSYTLCLCCTMFKAFQRVVSGLLQHNFSSVLTCYEWQPQPNLTDKSLLEVAIPLIVISVHMCT